MPEFISKSELSTQKNDNKKSYQFGEIYPRFFNSHENIEFKDDMKMEISILYVGSYSLDNRLFKRIKCPKCGKEEALVPYKLLASVLSGAHTISFYCSNCHEQFATNHFSEYYHEVSKYILDNRKNFTEEQKIPAKFRYKIL